VSVEPQIPPALREEVTKLQQMQNSLQGVLAQKQQVEVERIEIDRALEELKKAGEGDAVYKHAGSILIRSTRDALLAELEERKELSSTRQTVLTKQDERLREGLKAQEARVNEMIRAMQAPGAGGQPAAGGAPPGQPPQAQPPQAGAQQART